MSISLSKSLTKFVSKGKRLNDESKGSDKTLNDIIDNVIVPYAKEIFKHLGNVWKTPTISLSELMELAKLESTSSSHDATMKPDGGILWLTPFGQTNSVALLISEDKLQGTNDKLFQNGAKRQATGNAIERAAKNIRAGEMAFPHNIFSYVIFARGCDLHKSETISTRLTMMNYGTPNHYIDVDPNTTPEVVESIINNDIIPAVNIYKKNGKSIASVFIKAHKWNEMSPGSSSWTKTDIITICKNIIDQVFIAYMENILLMCFSLSNT